VLFACTLPSTVQSSIALTSIAEGNVAGAVCAATLSSLVGIVLTPVLFGLASKLHGSGINLRGIGSIILELLVPFAAGHLARPWIGGWAARNRAILAITDRSSILLVVYTAFSAAVVHGIWYQLPLATMGRLVVVVVLLLLSGLATTLLASRTLNLARPDEVAVVFCGSQKSLVSGVPIANVLFSSASIGPMLLPIMIYYPLQLVLCAWLARRYATAPAGVSAAAGDASLVVVEMPTSLR
jgi:sodium/bile acid cotransporter 7